ncbi:hypothetical protein BGZ65_010741 [Modicella reniformis]|uniref:DUF431-domain-containing protein n=1 Tax=Modicella reniformis TaxID=1440133 RepID=A0A9P6MJR8_9FUNG|nr:hypothetical protein BGZ65_010741 [Modicella reniformis]
MPESLAKAYCHTEDILTMGDRIPHNKVCLLDPASPTVLCPEDGDQFDFYLFGGILGDDPPRDRTSELRKLGFVTRHLGPVQMTTDTAVNVTRIVVEERVPLDQIPFIDHPEIKLRKGETVTMPFRYIVKQPISSASISSTPEGTTTTTSTTTVVTDETVGNTKKARKPKQPEPLLPPGMIELLKKDNDTALDLVIDDAMDKEN